MKTFIYSIALLLFSISTISAQKSTDAQAITRNLLSSLNTTAIKTDFELIASEKNKLNSHSDQGTFTMKGQRFVLEMPEVKVWFDGKTQWAFTTQTNEISITEPTRDEILEINPLAILNRSTSEMNINFSKKKSNENYIIEMTPKNIKQNLSKVELQINKSTNELKSIEINEKDGTTMTLKLKNYKKNIKLIADFFTCDKTQYKNAYINDLR
jgi:outer membrane lipoprotein-sorting protein